MRDMISNGYAFVIAILFCLAAGTDIAPAETPIVENWPAVSGDYLGQDIPGLKPELFAPFIAAPAHHKHSAPAFSPDGREVFYSVYLDYEYPQRIYRMRQVEGQWTRPELAPFASRYQEGGPYFSPDGQKLYFYSKRPDNNQGPQKPDADIWFVTRTKSGWSEPHNVGWPINTDRGEYGSQILANGTMYFVRTDTTETNYDLYRARLSDGRYQTSEIIGEPVSGLASIEFDCQVAPDESYLLFSSFRRGPLLDGGVFLSHRNPDGRWSEPKKTGDMINRGGARFVRFSPDGKYLFFASYRSGPEELYWVDAKVVDYLLVEDLNLADILTTTVIDRGVEAALVEHDELTRKHAAYYDADEHTLGNIGQRLIGMKKIPEAVAILRENLKRYPDAVPVVDRLKLALIDNDEDFWEELVTTLHEEPTHIESLENFVNRLGYQFLGWEMSSEAVRVLDLNRQLFPQSPNVYDSYAEALMGRGDNEGAIRNYEKVLELDPENSHALEVLKELRGN